MRWRAIAPLAVAIACSGAAADGGRSASEAAASCRQERLGGGYSGRVLRALRAGKDVWGNALLAAPDGPTYARARRYLKPLLLANAVRGQPLTPSGVHYVPFSGQVGIGGSGGMALHVADGGQILSQRAAGRSLTLGVGSGARERFGSCLARLTPPRLAGGFLPILETRYVDAQGVRYRQESFAAHIPQTRSLVSFVELTADASRSSAEVSVRFTASDAGLVADGNRLVGEGDTYLFFERGGSVDGSSITYEVSARSSRTIHVARLNTPAQAGALALDRATYRNARSSLARYWERRLSEGMSIEVPEKVVLDARRALLVQDLALTWRYSVGNPYQQFSFPEGVDVAQVLSTHGYSGVARAILAKSLTIAPTRYRNWKMGQKLVGSALHYRLFHDRSYVELATPTLRGYVADLGGQIRISPRGILNRERYSSDIPDSVYGLHSQAVVWQGLAAMASVWAATGHRSLAARCRSLAARLETGLRRAVRESQRRLPDGSLFVPVRLLDPEKPYDSVVESRSGGYWNLVAPYAFASGLFLPGSPQAAGVLRYLLGHGSRMLGVVRAGAYSLYGLNAPFPTSGVNPVYGLNVSRFLADNDRPDQLALSLYGYLAIAMAHGTFVTGEGVSVAPIGRTFHRTSYLPPNAASNASFLETLRLMLVHETRDREGAPHGLELAFATPRGWLGPGKDIVVRRAPTSFGLLSYSLRSSEASVRAVVDVPRRFRPRTLRLRLRLPRARITGARLDGRPFRRFGARTGTFELPTAAGRLELTVQVERP